MTDYLKNACEHLGVDRGDVINPRIEGDDYVLIVNKGIAGSPKYRIPLCQLEDDPLPVPAAYDLGLDDLSYRELQAMAQESGIPANQSKADLLIALESDEEEE
jgi:hypothetical protein